MVNSIERITNIAYATADEIRQSSSEIKSGFIRFFSSEGAYVVSKIYSLNGFEKLTKVLLFDYYFLTLFPKIQTIFTDFKLTIESQKDMYYATMIFGVFALCIKKDDNGNAIGLQFPSILKREDGFDWSMFFLSIAAFFYSAQFLKKYSICEFAFYSNNIAPLGNFFCLNKVPVIQSLFDGHPSEFFVVLSSFVDLYRGIKKRTELSVSPQQDKYWTMEKWEAYFKIAASLGKILGIGLYRQCGGMVWLGIAGLVSSHGSLFKFFLAHHRHRILRLESPLPIKI